MSLPAMHTVVGMSLPFSISAVIYIIRKRVTRRLLIITGILMIICGIWAEIPDMPRYLPDEYRHLEGDITNSRDANIFFFHGFLDTHQTEDSGLREGAVAIFIMFFLILFACSRTVLANQRDIDALKHLPVAEEVSEPKELNKLNELNEPNKPESGLTGLIDIHCHVLPGVDDGPGTIEESMKMCRRMVKLGFRHIVATPHFPWEGVYDTDGVLRAYDILKENIDRENLNLEISLGADVKITWDLVAKLKNKEIFTLAGSRYFLLEPEDFTVPDGFEAFMERCNNAGFHPVLTHPERNIVFQDDQERLAGIYKIPVLIQINSSSLTGSSGQKAQAAAIKLLEEGLVDIIVSDAHSSRFRLDEFRPGLAIAEDIVGPEKIEKMIITVPGMVLNNMGIEDIIRVSRGT